MKKTNRRYIAIVKRTKVNLREATTKLSSNAFKLLYMIYTDVIKGEDLDNNKAMKIMELSKHPYLKAKDELKEQGYIKVIQIGATKFVWLIGKGAIEKNDEKYALKEKLDREAYAQEILEYLSPKPSNETLEQNPPTVYPNETYVLEGFEQNTPNEIIVSVENSGGSKSDQPIICTFLKNINLTLF